MTKPDEATITGEERLRRRKAAFWRYMTLAFAVAMIAGLASGFLTEMADEGALPNWVPLLAWVVIVLGMVWFTRDYFRRVDELDLQDNLWAHLYGTYAAAAIWTTWYLVADLQLAQHPSGGTTMFILFASVLTVYGLRKLGLR